MPTEAGKAAVRLKVRQRMAGETNQDFAKRAKVDPQTLGDFIEGRRWPLGATLAKIEAALGLTPGTLAALGEEAAQSTPAKAPQHLVDVTDEELLAELGYRLTRLKRELTEAAKDQADDEDGRRLEDQKITELGDRRNASVPPYSRRLAADSGHPKMDDLEHE